jgi:hypothetical protein
VVLTGEGDERLASFRSHVGRVDDRQPAQCQAFRGDEVQDLEGVVRHGLIVFFVAEHRTARVGRHHFGRQEVLSRQGALA